MGEDFLESSLQKDASHVHGENNGPITELGSRQKEHRKFVQQANGEKDEGKKDNLVFFSAKWEVQELANVFVDH